jgi:DnaJ family protein B protein 4
LTLDSRHLHVPIDEIINPSYVKQVVSEGMPIHNDQINAENFKKKLAHGDLFIKFDIVFPKKLSEEQKQEIKKNLEAAI